MVQLLEYFFAFVNAHTASQLIPVRGIDEYDADHLLQGWPGQLQLLIVQPTPFCNIDCSYCYLLDRNNKSRMSLELLERAIDSVFQAKLPASGFSIVWHAGEPLVVPIDWYEKAFAIIEKYRPKSVKIRHHFQSNGTLLNPAWCKFIRQYDVQIGISIDGPEIFHDLNRKTRDGKGSFKSVMKGIAQLREAKIPFHSICVVTKSALQSPDQLFDFFSELGTRQLCFNIEEIEGANLSSSLTACEEDYKRFFSTILRRYTEGNYPFRIREVDFVLAALRSDSFGNITHNSQNQAGKILNIAWNGEFSTFSPELLGLYHSNYGSFVLGNINDGLRFSKSGLLHHRKVSNDIDRGIRSCQKQCKYFNFCMGGAPANKLAENGTFNSTETLYCRLTQKTIVDVVLDALDRELPL